MHDNKFASQPHVRMEIHSWNWAKKWHTKASQYFVTLDLILSNNHQECVATALTIWLFSGLRSSTIDNTYPMVCIIYGGTNLCWRYACFLPTSKGSAASSLSKHWSGDCRVCQTGHYISTATHHVSLLHHCWSVPKMQAYCAAQPKYKLQNFAVTRGGRDTYPITLFFETSTSTQCISTYNSGVIH